MKQGDLENLIMNVLWKHVSQLDSNNTPETIELDVQDIQQRLHEASPNRQWAYTTVKTVCDRVVQKGWAKRTKVGKRFMYQPMLNREQAGLEALQKLCKQYYQGSLSELETAFQGLKSRYVSRSAQPQANHQKSVETLSDGNEKRSEPSALAMA